MASITFDLNPTAFTPEHTLKYKDIQAPIMKSNANFDISVLGNESAVLNSLANIFTWKRGQRILNQEFGNPILPFVYEPITDITANKLSAAIKSAIGRWEPRVSVDNITIFPDADANEYRISITYSIPSLDQDQLNFDLNINRTNE
jgi:phage baseplate assembly protein W